MTDTPNFGDKEFPGVGYPTPLSIPDETTCRTFTLPADGSWQALLMGVVYTLTQPENWQQFEGGITREEAAGRWLALFESAYDDPGCPDEPSRRKCPTPYWDEDQDVDDEMTGADQPWYGYVESEDDLTFVEDFSIWAITGFLAVATWEIGALPAIAFRTIAPRFALAMRRGDIGEIFKIFINLEHVATVDTTSAAPGDVINVPLLTDGTEMLNDILIVNTGVVV